MKVIIKKQKDDWAFDFLGEHLELRELLGALGLLGLYSEDVEADGLAQWPALSNGNIVAILNTESRRNVGRYVVMPLLVTVVLGDEVEVWATDDEGSVHLGGDDGSGEDTSTDGDLTGERAFLVDISTPNGGLWGLEAQPNVLVPSSALCCLLLLRRCLVGEEDMWLLLERTFRLDG